jgi:hypothetical protein
MLVSSIARTGLVAESRRTEAVTNNLDSQSVAAKTRQEQATAIQVRKEQAVESNEAALSRPPESSGETRMALSYLTSQLSGTPASSEQTSEAANAAAEESRMRVQERTAPTVEEMSERVQKLYQLE